jgi:hypothetical protein
MHLCVYTHIQLCIYALIRNYSCEETRTKKEMPRMEEKELKGALPTIWFLMGVGGVRGLERKVWRWQ